MADVRSFRGLRYDMAKVGALSDVIAPPYDVIDAKLQDELYGKSPYNIIRLELNKEEPGDAGGNNRYTRAAEYFKSWRRDGILEEEKHPSLYLYHQTYRTEAGEFTRKGFFARVKLERFGEGKIYPHEQTLSGPKADRLALFHAVKANLSPIFGLYPDAAGEVLASLEAGVLDKTPLEAVDHLGVVNRLWVVDDSRTHSIVQGLMGPRPIFIADGHHRYETGLNLRDELAAAGMLEGDEDPANFCMMALVGMSDPGLLIMPTHRLVSGLKGLDSSQLVSRLEPEFEITKHGKGEQGCRAAWEAIELADDQHTLGFGTLADDEWISASLLSDEAMDAIASGHSPEWRSLGVSILRELVVNKLLADLGSPKFDYVHQISEVLEFRARGAFDLAALVPAATMEHVEQIASNHETMPPKSTYFYPKLVSGLVVNPLR